MAKEQNRPKEYLSQKIRKEQRAAEIAKRDGIKEGCVCNLSAVEPCRTFSFRFERGKPFVASARRRCL